MPPRSEEAVPLNVTTAPSRTARSAPASAAGGVVSTTSNDPADEAAFPASSRAHTVNVYPPTSAGVTEYAYESPPWLAIVKLPRTAPVGSRTETDTLATPTLSVTVAVIVVGEPSSTGSGAAAAELIVGAAKSTYEAVRETHSNVSKSPGFVSTPGSRVTVLVPRPVTVTPDDAVKLVNT